MTLQQKAQEYVEASGLSLKTDKGEQAYNAYIAGAKENMEGLLEWIDGDEVTWRLFNRKMLLEGGNVAPMSTIIEMYLKQKEDGTKGTTETY